MSQIVFLVLIKCMFDNIEFHIDDWLTAQSFCQKFRGHKRCESMLKTLAKGGRDSGVLNMGNPADILLERSPN